MSQCSSYRMDSVHCTVPAAHNHQLRTSEKHHNSLYSTIKHAAHTMRERKREEGRGREGEKEGGREGRQRGREGGKGGRKEGKEGEREGHSYIHSIYIHPPTSCIIMHTFIYIDCSCKLAIKTLSACIS